VTKFRKSVPPNVAAAVARSLEKLPADRFESAKALVDALQNPAYTTTSFSGDTEGAYAGNRRRVVSMPLLAASLIAVVGVAGWVSTVSRKGAVPVKRTRFTIVVPDSARIRPEMPFQNFAFSPDGSAIVYRGGLATDQLYLRDLNDLAPRAIPGTDGASQTKFSPDGAWLAFLQNRRLVKIPVSGGPAVGIADSVSNFSWGDRGEIVLVMNGSFFRVSASGGKPVLLVQRDSAKKESYVWPHLLPGGKALLFDIVMGGDQTTAELAAMRLDDGKVVRLGVRGRNPRYVSTGHILFSHHDGTVSAAAFDATALRITGPAVTVLENVYVKSGGASEYGVSRDGTLFMVQGQSMGEILAIGRDGTTRPLVTERRLYAIPVYSPTSDRFAYQMSEKTSISKTDIWVYNDQTKTSSRLTNDGNSTVPAWMADGERITWIVRDSAGVHVRRQRWDGSGAPETLFNNDGAIVSVMPAPHSNLFAVMKNGGFSDIYLAEGDPPGAVRPLVVTPTGEGGARISPDGRWVAYYADESGRREVYVVSAMGDGGRHQISTEGGAEPLWGPDGKTLYYRNAGHMMAASIVTSPAFAVTARTALFADRYQASGSHATYDVSHDGQSFLMIGTGDEAALRIVVVTGWLDELRERMAQATKK
jgi:serine/threonine-protein kinase